MISVSNKKWSERFYESKKIDKCSQDNDFSQILSKLVVSRKFNDEGDFSFIESRDSIFSFEKLQCEAMFKKLSKLNIRSKLDVLDIDSKLLRMSAAYIAPQLTRIFNLSLESGVIPTNLKTAKIIPIYKGKGDIDSCSNYRPISTLPFIAKIIESCVQEQLLHYLNKYQILCPEQSKHITA